MAIVIEKRVRAVNTDPWGAWASTTDAAPYTDTDLVQYRVENTTNISTPDLSEIVDGALGTVTSINISDITNNVQVVDDDGKFKAVGDGYFDDLMESINLQLKAQYDSGRIKGPEYARVYTSLFQTAMGQAMQFALNKRSRELATDSAGIDLAKKAVELDVVEATQQTKVDLAEAQLAKVLAETSYVDEQETQLINSVDFNNKIKAADLLGDTYGTFGAGGLTVSSDMWTTLFNIVSDLTSQPIPTSTTVTKVT